MRLGKWSRHFLSAGKRPDELAAFATVARTLVLVDELVLVAVRTVNGGLPMAILHRCLGRRMRRGQRRAYRRHADCERD